MRKPCNQTVAELLTRMLSAYPTMMLRKETFPAFINKEHHLTETMVNCMSLARMFVDRTPETSNLLWRTIRMEHERLWLEV